MTVYTLHVVNIILTLSEFINKLFDLWIKIKVYLFDIQVFIYKRMDLDTIDDII